MLWERSWDVLEKARRPEIRSILRHSTPVLQGRRLTKPALKLQGKVYQDGVVGCSRLSHGIFLFLA